MVQERLTGRSVEGEGSKDASSGIESRLGSSQPAEHCACMTLKRFLVDSLILISVFGLPLSLAILGSVEEKCAFCCAKHPLAVQGRLSVRHFGDKARRSAVEGGFMILPVR